MDVAAPLLAVCLFAAQELEPWQRFPPYAVCKANWMVAEKYCLELQAGAEAVGGLNAERLIDGLIEARARQRVWWELWWVAENTTTERKNEHAELLRGMIGDRAFYAAEWPGPLPAHHFPVAGGR